MQYINAPILSDCEKSAINALDPALTRLRFVCRHARNLSARSVCITSKRH